MSAPRPTRTAAIAALFGLTLTATAQAQLGPETTRPAEPGAIPGTGAVDPGQPALVLAGLDHPALATLRGDLLALWQDDPGAFADLEAARARASQADRHKRGRLAPLGRELKTLGPRALLPMLHLLHTDDPRARPMALTAWIAWRAGLIEAVGALRDPRGLPALLAVLDGPDHDPTIVRAAVAAVGKLGSDAAVAALIARSERPERAPAAQRAFIEGLGTARRLAVVEHLGGLATRVTASQRVALARALGDLGNAWAWETPGLRANGEGDTVRAAAARQLLALYPAHDEPALRAELTKSLLLVDHPEAPRWAADAGEPALAERLRRSPLHRR